MLVDGGARTRISLTKPTSRNYPKRTTTSMTTPMTSPPSSAPIPRMRI